MNSARISNIMKFLLSSTLTRLFRFSKWNLFSFDLQFSMDNYRGLIQDMSPQDREVK